MNEASRQGEVLGGDWEEHAQFDPLWAILSADEKLGRQWDVYDFFSIGAHDIDCVMADIDRLDIPVSRGKALDFGCGVGRLSQALADYFESVVGVDVSPTMIRLARELNFNGDQVEFLLNQVDDLSALESGAFDFVNSLITLQHIPPEVTKSYLREFLRILKPGGILMFDLPATRRDHIEDVIENEPMPLEAYAAKIRVVDSPAAMAPGSDAKVRVAVTNASRRDWEPGELAKQNVDTHWQAGDGTWKAAKIGHVDVGNHWLSFDGAMVINDDGRVSLPQGMSAGDEAEVELVIKAPATSGTYVCQVDVVHERVAWFAQHGSPTAQFRVGVGESAAANLFGPLSRLLLPLRRLYDATVTRYRVTGRERSRKRRRYKHQLERRWNAFKAQLPEPATTQEPEPYDMHGTPRSDVIGLLEGAHGEVLVAEEAHSAGWAWESYRYFVRKR